MAGRYEEFDVEAPAGERDAPGPRTPRPARSAVGFFVIGLLLVAVGIVIAPRPDPYEHGIVPHLQTPPQLLWEVPLDSSHASSGHVWIGSGEVVATGSNSVHGVDLTTGEIAWDVRAPELRCAREAEDIACVSRQGARAELIEMTMAGGESGRTVQNGLIAALPHEGGLITLFDQSGSLSVMRWGSDGEHIWSHAVDATGADLDGLVAAVLGEMVLIQAPGQDGGALLHRALAVADGSVRSGIDALPSDDGGWVVRHDDAITWYGPDGAAISTRTHGSVLRVDDDPRSDLVFTGEGSAFRALSASDGTEVWQHPLPGLLALPHARLADTLVGWADGVWYGLEVSDGDVRWSRPGDFPRCPCLGSGTILAGVSGEPDSVLTGIDVTSGAQRWQVPLVPSSGFSYGTSPTHLAVFSRHGLSAWSLEQR